MLRTLFPPLLVLDFLLRQSVVIDPVQCWMPLNAVDYHARVPSGRLLYFFFEQNLPYIICRHRDFRPATFLKYRKNWLLFPYQGFTGSGSNFE